ncbi:MAG TPA: gamma-glutamylcyclotransferase family protein [Terriglobia bacterium]|nr:gamma-glutamylcyclotransferase family protein [Terriglobia bacterium]
MILPPNPAEAAFTDLLFVYGTLRRDFERHRELERLGARFVAEGSIKGALFDLGPFPGARRTGPDARRVQGELYRLPRISKALFVLDQIEGFCPDSPDSSLFVRETTEVSLPNGERVSAWVYWLNHWKGPMRRIPSGDYRRG